MKVVVPLADGFEEIEFTTIVDILRRAGISVVTAGIKAGPIEGSHMVKVVPDTALDKIDPDDFDGIVLPGGYPGFVNLGEDVRVLKMIQTMDEKERYIAAICGAPSVLLRAGIMEGRKATVHPAGRSEFRSDQYLDDRVVVDGNIITSKAPGTAMEFALKIVEILAGRERMKAVKEEVFAKF